MKGQLSAEMLILIVVIIAIVAIAATQLLNQAKSAAQQINSTSTSIMEKAKICDTDSDCSCLGGKVGRCVSGICECV
ncbi:MAG: hypothetical protein QW153_01360 [Candidatus Bilamarchaeaceae archaeon]